VNTSPPLLPGQRHVAGGTPRLDYRAVAALALPFMANNAVQAVLNATDTRFMGRISPTALAAMGAVYWPVLVFVFLFGGIGLSVQTLVAQATGSRRRRRASQATWLALWGALLTIPAFVALAALGYRLFGPFGLPPGTLDLAVSYWNPRMLGAPLGVALWALLGFFNGIGRPGVSLQISLGVAVLNVLFNQWFIVGLHGGIAGSAWATNLAQLCGLVAALCWFLAPRYRDRYASLATWHPHRHALWRQFRLGLPIGLMIAADILGFALFQLMQVRLGTVDGAATQIVMVLTSFCYLPGYGIAMAGTTLVGQAIGAGQRDWARHVGNAIILLVMLLMGLIGIVLAIAGPWLMPWFAGSDAGAGAIAAQGCVLLWIAAGYQLFDGLSIASSSCLRGAGDATVPAAMVLFLSWSLFIPLAHSLSFAPGAGWIRGLPQFGLGVVGGWLAALAYMAFLGVLLFARWHSGAWRRLLVGLAGAAVAGALVLDPGNASAAMPAPVAAALQSTRISPDAMSFVVSDAVSGQVLAAHNAAELRSPASTMKVLTTFAALDSLGPAFTWHTRALASGRLQDGVLDGDLVLQGGGDPYLTLERWWAFVRQLRATGLREIRGDVVIDHTAYALPAEDPGAFDGRPNRLYNVVPDALLVNFQSVDFRIAPDPHSRSIRVTAEPHPANLVVENHVRFVNGRCSARADRVEFDVAGSAGERVVFSGTLAAQCAPREFTRALLRPAEYAYGTFAALWREAGGELGGHLRIGAAAPDAQPLLSYDSPSLAELLRLTNKFSNNVMARELYLTLGMQRLGLPATPDKSRAAMVEWGRGHGLDLSGVTIENGAGLSREERISAAQLAAVLALAYRSPFQPEFLASLPIGGLDGTLRSRFRDAPPGAVRLKTGHLAGVNAIAGYVTAADGHAYIVVSIANDARADYGGADPVHAALVRWVLGLGAPTATDTPAPTTAR
jgi:MATE family multidrug resistance protein